MTTIEARRDQWKVSKAKSRLDPTQKEKQRVARKTYKKNEKAASLKRRLTKCGWAKYILVGIRHRAKKRNLEFNLTWEDIIPPDTCPVLGIPLNLGSSRGSNLRNCPNAPSIDRFDNSKGYTKDNVRVISYRANALKSDASINEIQLIYNYMSGGVL